MAKRTILQCFFKAAGELLEEELEARQKARKKGKKPPPAPESQAKPEEPKTEPQPEEQATSEEPSTATEPEAEPSAAGGNDHAAAPPRSSSAAPEGASAEAPAANTTRAQPPVSNARWATDLGASVHDPPRSDTWDFSGAADAGASIDGGDTPADDAHAVQAVAHRGGADSPARDATPPRRRRWRGHVRRRRVMSSSSEPASSEQTTELQRLHATVELLRSEVSAIRVQKRASAAETDPIRAARPPGGTTPGVVARVVPRPDLAESGALDRPPPGDPPGSRPEQAKATEPAETPSTQDDELPPLPEWYLNTPIVGREAWEIDEDAEPELIDDEIDYTQIEEYDPRDDPDMERVA